MNARHFLSQFQIDHSHSEQENCSSLNFQQSVFLHMNLSTMNHQPTFLSSSPSTICDQILYLVKNSNLNFDLHETPFSLSLNLKKSFANHWKKPDHHSPQNHTFNRTHLPHQPVHQPHHTPQNQPSVVQPQGSSQNDLFSNSYVFQLPQQHTHAPQEQVDALAHPSKLSSAAAPQDVLHQIESIRAEHEVILKENLNDYAELDKAHRKLLKETKELQVKHTKVCSELKTLKLDNAMLVKESNSLSVALKSSKKDLETSERNFQKEKEAVNADLENLKIYKANHQEEIRKAKKLEKKTRQKAKKKLYISENETVKSESENSSTISLTDILEEKTNEQKKAETGEERIDKKDKENNLKSEDPSSVDALKDVSVTKPVNENKDVSKGGLETSVVEEKASKTYTFKSRDHRFLEFPSNFEEWSEDQKKDAYDNNFKLYLTTSLGFNNKNY